MAYEHDRVTGTRPDAPYYDRRDTGSAGVYIGIAVVVALVLALVAFYAGSGSDTTTTTVPPAGAPVQEMAPPAPPATMPGDGAVAPMDTAPPADEGVPVEPVAPPAPAPAP